MASVITGVVAGLAYGVLVGYIKYAALWKKMLKSKEKVYRGALYVRLGIGYAINVATLLFVFLMRDIMPCNFMAAIIAAAVGLSLSGKLAPMTQVVDCVKETE